MGEWNDCWQACQADGRSKLRVTDDRRAPRIRNEQSFAHKHTPDKTPKRVCLGFFIYCKKTEKSGHCETSDWKFDSWSSNMPMHVLIKAWGDKIITNWSIQPQTAWITNANDLLVQSLLKFAVNANFRTFHGVHRSSLCVHQALWFYSHGPKTFRFRLIRDSEITHRSVSVTVKGRPVQGVFPVFVLRNKASEIMDG